MVLPTNISSIPHYIGEWLVVSFWPIRGLHCAGLSNQRRGVGETFHLSQLQTVFCGFSIFSVLKQINVDRNMKNILSPLRQIRCISMCSSLFLKNVPIPVWARRWREGVGAVGRVPAVVHSLYCPLLKLAFCTDLGCDDLLMGEDWDDRMGNKHQLLATQGNFCRSVGLIDIMCSFSILITFYQTPLVNHLFFL